jgi:outer membrane protein assembly factor BamB
VLYAASDVRKVHTIDAATNTEIWSFGVTGVPGAPAIVGGRIIVGTSLGKLESIAGDDATVAPEITR